MLTFSIFYLNVATRFKPLTPWWLNKTSDQRKIFSYCWRQDTMSTSLSAPSESIWNNLDGHTEKHGKYVQNIGYCVLIILIFIVYSYVFIFLLYYSTVHMIRQKNTELRLQQALAWMKAGERFHDVIFSDETTVSMEQFALRCYRKKGRASYKPKPKHPLKVHVWGAISRQGPGPILIFEGNNPVHGLGSM